jgi:hypothetical protein
METIAVVLHEPVRSSIHHRFTELLGEPEATALMDQFPPFDHDDVVTKPYLDHRLSELRAHMDHRFEQVDGRFEQVEIRIGALSERLDIKVDALSEKFDIYATALPATIIKQVVFWMVPAVFASMGFALAAATWAGG